MNLEWTLNKVNDIKLIFVRIEPQTSEACKVKQTNIDNKNFSHYFFHIIYSFRS